MSTVSEAPVYLDNAATTPVRDEVRAAMLPFLDERFGNPSSLHRFGQDARAAVDRARRQVADAVGAEPGEVVFTSGGTEADNLAVLGGALAARAAGRPFSVAVSAIEHKAVLGAAHAVEGLGGELVVLPVDRRGAVRLDALDEVLARGVGLVSVIWVNNEIGLVQEIDPIARRCAAAGVPFHTDAVQALGKVPCRIDRAPITLLTLSGHKIGAPKGVGALVVRDRHAVHPLLHGGGQQQGLRPGTENVAGIVALGMAVELAVGEREATARHTARLRDTLEQAVTAALPDAVVHGGGGRRAPHISSLGFADTDSESLMMHLDLAGIACSSGSACTTGAVEPSHVLTALHVPDDLALGTLRFSFAKTNTPDDVRRVVSVLPTAVRKIRALATRLRR